MDGMDRKIEKKFKFFSKRTLWISIVTIIVFLVAYNLIFGDKSSKLNVEMEKISVSEINRDIFQDYIAVIGTVEPIQTIYLDAIESGRVEELLKEEGSKLKKGDVILRLSNNNLILEISNVEAQIARAVNDQRNARLMMVQQQLNSESQIIETERLLAQHKRAYKNNKILYDQNHISFEDYEQSKEMFEASRKRLNLLKELQLQDSIFRVVQIESMNTSVNSLTKNMVIIKTRLDALNIKAPVDGELATINPEIGEVVTYGSRIGTINILDSYKLRVEIDEHYIARVNRGLVGECDFASTPYHGRISKIYPEVQNGRFYVDMTFTEGTPPQIKIGQTSRIKLELGESKEAILIPRGGFYQSTGGQWVFVIDPGGEFAYKRDISIGRQNPKYYEVLGGLEVGERVITSSYDNFGDVDKLVLKE
ncbi:MAG: efflux RND transporter periplasmic adaptor subunit [Bacteroidales bacterium]|nr:efflux RND transporter periplasmic adaptor subunit [Bacteroidales bacterium]